MVLGLLVMVSCLTFLFDGTTTLVQQCGYLDCEGCPRCPHCPRLSSVLRGVEFGPIICGSNRGIGYRNGRWQMCSWFKLRFGLGAMCGGILRGEAHPGDPTSHHVLCDFTDPLPAREQSWREQYESGDRGEHAGQRCLPILHVAKSNKSGADSHQQQQSVSQHGQCI